MISHIRGNVIDIGDKYAVVDTGGIGYQIFISVEASASISVGAEANFWTHMAVRENSMELFGFIDREELDFFEMLIGISGIGPRGALTIISVAPVSTLKKAIGSGDTAYLTKISGIGKKTAEKMVIELRDKLSQLGHKSANGEHKEEMDALEALKSLGYSQNEARDALKNLPPEITSTNARIKEALKFLAK
jgi:Holliday junction DNA helicase RuvA